VDGEFKAVLAGVAATSSDDRQALAFGQVQGNVAGLTEVPFLQVNFASWGKRSLKDLFRKRALESNEAVRLLVGLQVTESNDRVDGVVPVGQSLVKEFVILGTAAGVQDDVEEMLGAFLQASDDTIVDDATSLGVQERAESGAAGLKVFDASRCDTFEEGFGAGSFDMVLDHVANVEDRSLLASPLVAFANTEIAVLHRHAVATERDHFGAVCKVEVVEIGFAQVSVIVESGSWGDLCALVSCLLAEGQACCRALNGLY
jgi:hypothetical protein